MKFTENIGLPAFSVSKTLALSRLVYLSQNFDEKILIFHFERSYPLAPLPFSSYFLFKTCYVQSVLPCEGDSAHRGRTYRWFSHYVIAAMLVGGKQKIAH